VLGFLRRLDDSGFLESASFMTKNSASNIFRTPSGSFRLHSGVPLPPQIGT
jgi:hypothetical protein